jgi:hypothetical protein
LGLLLGLLLPSCAAPLPSPSAAAAAAAPSLPRGLLLRPLLGLRDALRPLLRLLLGLRDLLRPLLRLLLRLRPLLGLRDLLRLSRERERLRDLERERDFLLSLSNLVPLQASIT